jgi:hypothetical protein
MQNRERIIKQSTFWSRSAGLAFLFLMVAAMPARSQSNTTDAANEQAERDGLRVSDYKTVPVVVMEIEPNSAKITEDAVKSHTESRMKAAGLTLVSDPNDRFLLISVHVEGAAFDIDIGFYRRASWELPDGKIVQNFLETWNAGDSLGTHDNSDAPIMKELDTRLEIFLSAYLRANQNTK